MTSAKDLDPLLKDSTNFYLYSDITQNPHSFFADLYLNRQAIVLIRANKTYGHWICLKVDFTNRTIYYFSSFGTIPDFDKVKYISKEVNAELKQQMNAISQVLKDYFHKELGFEIRYNQYKYQDPKDKNDQTCGLWCVLFLNLGLSEDGFHRIIRKWCKIQKVSYKEFIKNYFRIKCN